MVRLAIAFGVISVALMAIGIYLLPSKAARLTDNLNSPAVALAVVTPKIGDFIKLPKTDEYGRPITVVDGMLVVAMPSCETCAIKRLNMAVLSRMSAARIILVFPESLPQKWPVLKEDHFRVLIEHGRPLLPESMHVFAPTCVWIDRSQRVTKTQTTLDADGLKKELGSP